MNERRVARNVVGGLFLAGAVMLWLGWVLLPAKLGAHFLPTDFAAVREHYRPWIWLYRMHLFGYVVSAMALAGLAAALAGHPSRVLAWPGTAAAVAGLFVGALASAFYYHFGAWGAMTTGAFGPPELRDYIAGLSVATEYVTCLTRFSRVFFGLGQAFLCAALLRWKVLPRWVPAAGALLGVAAMALTMGLPDDLALYRPIFHLNAAWLAAVGAASLRALP